MKSYSAEMMQAALDNAKTRDEELKITWPRDHGSEWNGNAAGFVETKIGTVSCHFVQADSRISLKRHATRTCWKLNGKRISEDNLIKQLNAA